MATLTVLFAVGGKICSAFATQFITLLFLICGFASADLFGMSSAIFSRLGEEVFTMSKIILALMFFALLFMSRLIFSRLRSVLFPICLTPFSSGFSGLLPVLPWVGCTPKALISKFLFASFFRTLCHYLTPSRFAFSRIASSITPVMLKPDFFARSWRSRFASGLSRKLSAGVFSMHHYGIFSVSMQVGTSQ